MAEIEHPNLAVMFTDIKDYSALMSHDEARALVLLVEHNRIMESVIEAHGGQVVKKLGDAYMVIFQETDAAVKCGLHALGKMAARNRSGQELVEIRVGIHVGPMVERDGDFFGEHVNIAARLEQLAEPMTISVSEQVVQDVATRIKAEAQFVSAQMLKHIRYPVSVYALTPGEAWKLYLGPEGSAAEVDSSDLLADIGATAEAWPRVERLVHEGNLHQATSLGEAALSRFGGTFAQYAQLAGLYLIAGFDLEAESALKRGTMLGQKDAHDDQFDWLQVLVHHGQEGLKRCPEELDKCLTRAQSYASAHPTDLAMQVLIEGIKARCTGQAEGLAVLAQQNQSSALVLRGYAEALKDLHHLPEASSLLEQTITVAPEVVDHQLRRVEWMVGSEDLDAVLRETEHLTTTFPQHPRVYEWTGKTRLLGLDPHGAEWVFEQGQEGQVTRSTDAAGWLITSVMQQGRFTQAIELARKELRSAVRQNRERMARIFLKMATTGMYLQHWEGTLEILEEYKRYDADWLFPRAATIAAKQTRKLIPWERALSQLNELSSASADTVYPHPSGETFFILAHAVSDAEQWAQLHELEFYREHRDWLVQSGKSQAAVALEARGALLFDSVDSWHLQLVPILTRLRARLDHRLPSFLALAGLIEARLNNFEGGKAYLEQARKLWRNADWPVWEIQEAESVLAAGGNTVTQAG